MKQKTVGKTMSEVDEARLLCTWQKPLFWLMIAKCILSYAGKDEVLSLLPWMRYPSYIGSALCGAAICVCLGKCAPVCDRYQKATVFTALAVFMNAVVSFSTNSYVDTLVGYPAVIVDCFGLYLTYTAHAAVLSERAALLSARYRELWKYTLVTTLGMFLSIFIARASGIFALLLLIACSAGNIIVTVCAIVFQYRAIRVYEMQI